MTDKIRKIEIIVYFWLQVIPPNYLSLDSDPNLGPLISRWEINKFENCWYKSVRILEFLKLLFQQFLNLSSSQRDMSGPILGDLSNNRWSGGITVAQDVCVVTKDEIYEEKKYKYQHDLRRKKKTSLSWNKVNLPSVSAKIRPWWRRRPSTGGQTWTPPCEPDRTSQQTPSSPWTTPSFNHLPRQSTTNHFSSFSSLNPHSKNNNTSP